MFILFISVSDQFAIPEAAVRPHPGPGQLHERRQPAEGPGGRVRFGNSPEAQRR